jgi:hypothetical protein
MAARVHRPLKNDRPVFSSERTPHVDKTVTGSNKNLVLGPGRGLTPRLTGRLAVGCNVTLIWF